MNRLRNLDRHPVFGVAAGSGTLASVAAVAVAAMLLAGAPDPTPDAPPLQLQAGMMHTRTAEAPALRVLTAALETPPAGWAPGSPVENGVSLPFPYTCPTASTAPSVALSRTFTAAGAKVQVVTAAYTAGLGAEAMALQVEGAYTCAGGDASVNVWAETGIATDYSAVTTRGGVTAAVAAFRRGDVIVYLVGPGTAAVNRAAAEFDAHLGPALAEVCADTGSGYADAVRSPFSASGYKGLLVDRKVSIPARELPELTEDEEQERDEGAPRVRPVPLDSEPLEFEAAEPLPVPEYPVWPEMPEEADLPEAPEAPQAKPKTTGSVKVPTEDPAGPGCGWSFTGGKPLAFDVEAARQTADKAVDKARAKLESGADRWESDVLGFWAGWAGYKADVEAYREYAEEVDKVNRAWNKIAAAWDEYRAEFAVWEAAEENLQQFLEDRRAARIAHEKELARCEADAEKAARQAKKQAEMPATSPDGIEGTDSTAGVRKQQEEAVEVPDCSLIEAPDILDAEEPEVPEKPDEPADPRPKDRQ